MRRRWKSMIGVAVVAVLAVAVLCGASALLTPHVKAENPEMFLLKEALASAHGDACDVVFLGDCEVYSTFSPVTLWQTGGIATRVYGSPQQLLWHSEAILREVLRRESPRVVVLGVYGLCYDAPQSEAYNRMALDALPLSADKLAAVRASMTEGENFLSYIFPLLRYHGRWSQLTWTDVRTLWQAQEAVSYDGYLLRREIIAASSARPDHTGAMPPSHASFGETAMRYLERIATLCRESGIPLVLVKAPTDSWRYPWYDEYEEQIRAWAEDHGVAYYNLLEAFDTIGLDLTTDSYDGGTHLNVWGADKVSAYFAGVLMRDFELPDRRQEATICAVREPLAERYVRERAGRAEE